MFPSSIPKSNNFFFPAPEEAQALFDGEELLDFAAGAHLVGQRLAFGGPLPPAAAPADLQGDEPKGGATPVDCATWLGEKTWHTRGSLICI